MTWPHFDQGKGFRLVRPRRMVILEWLRAVRHNVMCDYILWQDKLMQSFTHWRKPKPTETILSSETSEWGVPLGDRFRENRMHAVLEPRSRWSLTALRELGMPPAFWPLIFALGIVLGFALKWQAENTLTIGYNDYTLPKEATLYDIGALEKNLLLKTDTTPAPAPSYPACSLLVQ